MSAARSTSLARFPHPVEADILRASNTDASLSRSAYLPGIFTQFQLSFSRKIENHMAAVAMNYFAFNFIKIHSQHAARNSGDGRWRYEPPIRCVRSGRPAG